MRHLEKTFLCGTSQKMSLLKNTTRELWSGFMPQLSRIPNRIETDLISMQVFDKGLDFNDFDPSREFTKWAAVRVSDHSQVPTGLQSLVLNGGLYAVFIHKGTPQQFPKTLTYIFSQWLPASGYELDHREHFELLTDKYSPDDPDAMEEVWIPLKPLV